MLQPQLSRLAGVVPTFMDSFPGVNIAISFCESVTADLVWKQTQMGIVRGACAKQTDLSSTRDPSLKLSM